MLSAVVPGIRSLESIRSLQQSWDDGNLVAVNTPIVNEFPFNWANILIAYDEKELPTLFWEHFLDFAVTDGVLPSRTPTYGELLSYCERAREPSFMISSLEMELQFEIEDRGVRYGPIDSVSLLEGQVCGEFFSVFAEAESRPKIKVSIVDSSTGVDDVLGSTFLYSSLE